MSGGSRLHLQFAGVQGPRPWWGSGDKAPDPPASVAELEDLGHIAHVTLIGNLRQFTGGVTELDLEAATVRQLFAKLGEKFPALLPHLETGSAVAIDGQIYQDALFQPIGPDSDVHILPQIAGG